MLITVNKNTAIGKILWVIVILRCSVVQTYSVSAILRLTWLAGDVGIAIDLGETAPLLMVGALAFIAFNPTLLGDFTALPIQIFQWISRPQEEFQLKAAAAIIVLLALLLVMNAFAIWIRNRYQKRW